jgi:TonB family protein
MRAGILLIASFCVAAELARAAAPLTDIRISDAQATASGQWNYKLSRSASAFACGRDQCVEQVVTVVNKSAQTLECSVRIDYKRADGSVANSFDTPALVLPGSSPVVHGLTTSSALQAEVTRLSCTARDAFIRVAKRPECKYDMFGEPFENYYPSDAMQLSQQGPVIVAFTLKSPNGVAKDIKVVESSLIPSLDQSARKFIADQMFSTNCPGQRFDILMRFKLRDKVLMTGN